jgi:hypothetical protein
MINQFDSWLEEATLRGWTRKTDGEILPFNVLIDRYAKYATVVLADPVDSLNEKELLAMLNACRLAKRMRNAARKKE